ncbi:hypothetical protein QOZ80_3BG0279340 [Eleusine coracana subsp. coracana]|nr:hypothetical protein QOZ80_3BG0279340 [Eleusine coracana subsp. coracana]
MAARLTALVAAVLLFLPSLLAPVVVAQPKGAKAFCISQFAIASQACSILPPSPPDEHHHHDDDEDEDDDEHDDDDDRRRSRGRRHGHRAKAIGLAALLASNDSHMSVVVAANGTAGHGHHGNRTRGGHHGRGRGRGRGRLRDGEDDDHHDTNDPDHDDDEHDDDHHDTDDPDHDDDEHEDDDDEDDDDDDDDDDHHDEELRAYRDCCRWLKEVQKDCVCEALMRLPPFLVKPQHTYVVRVGRTCQITYRCGGV